MLVRIQLHYRKGSAMFPADALSQAYLPYDESQKTVVQEFESVNMLEDTTQDLERSSKS